MEVAEVTARAGRPPGLAVVLVGGRPDSKIYVHRKEEACRKARRFALAPVPFGTQSQMEGAHTLHWQGIAAAATRAKWLRGTQSGTQQC